MATLMTAAVPVFGRRVDANTAGRGIRRTSVGEAAAARLRELLNCRLAFSWFS